MFVLYIHSVINSMLFPGRLGVGTRTTQLHPQPVELPDNYGTGENGQLVRQLKMGQVVGLAAGEDSSILITSSGQLLAAGSNRYNTVQYSDPVCVVHLSSCQPLCESLMLSCVIFPFPYPCTVK